jgi:Glyoxalase-like domain
MLKLDHLVINTRFDLDAAQSVFEKLGFLVAPRGYHTLGSINHTIVFDDHYLELIGLPADGKIVREEILSSPLGADGLVFRSDDPAATFAALTAAGFDATAPQVFSRPVEGLGDAGFATVRIKPGQLEGGRVYFCQHLTPERVFRDEWKRHPNGAYALSALHLVDVPAQAYGRLGTLDPRFELIRWTRARFVDHFGALGLRVALKGPRYAAITMRTPQWQALGVRALAQGLPTMTDERRTLVALPGLDTLLEFIA